MERTIDISEAIDQSKIGAFQTGIFILCALCLIMDGFDVQALGYLAPAIIKDWSLPPAQMGPVLSAALVGILVGSLLFSMLADRFGRRPVLIVATLFFSLITLWTGLAGSISELRLARFVAGVGLGGIMPNAVALVGEYTPRRWRVLMMIVVSNGFNVGAIVAGLVSARMIPVFGWRSVFYFGAALPMVIGLIMLVFLPESLQFLAVRGKNPSKLRKWLGRINREAAQAGTANRRNARHILVCVADWTNRVRAGTGHGIHRRRPQHCLHRPACFAACIVVCGGVLGRLLRRRRAGSGECARGDLLSHPPAFDRCGVGFRYRPYRR